MLSRKLWMEWSETWPAAFWDDWVREPEQRKGRDCIRPEIGRTYTFGEVGTSQGQFFEQYLKDMQLNSEDIDWDEEDLSYLEKENYDNFVFEELKQATILPTASALEGHPIGHYLFFYTDFKDFQAYANFFRVMSDEKAGIARTSYEGIVSFYYNSHRIHLVPIELKPKIEQENDQQQPENYV